ncbi:MAG TPA: hypothetical protein VFF73_28590 [Planctomycetota bacterium]|nr:hypothetical protein [Planctomycetota bacterium]
MAPNVRILSLTTTAGLLKDVLLELGESLTCLIGDPGSGKSTSCETLRFLFNRDPKWLNMLLGHLEPDYGPNHPEHGHLRSTLAEGTAVCRVQIDYGETQEIVRIERNAADHTPRVYRDGTDDPADPSILECIEVYSQGDVQRIAEDTRRRLALLDRRERAALDSIASEFAAAAIEVREVDVELAMNDELIESQEAQLTHLKEKREQVALLKRRRPAASPELEAERTKFNKRRDDLATFEALEEYRMQHLVRLAEAIKGEARVREALKALSEHDVPEARELEKLFAPFAALLQSTGSSAQLQKQTIGGPLIKKLRARFEEQDRPYHKLREQQQQVAVAQRAEDEAQRELNRLEKIDAECRENKEKRAEFVAKREGLREKIRKLASQRFKIRLKLADEINQQFHDIVKLELHEGAYAPPEYRKAIAEFLQGSGFKKQEELADDLAKVPPNELISAIEDRDPKFLAAHLGRDRGQMQRLVEHLDDVHGREIYSLEKFFLDDELEIFLMDKGEWRPIRLLSRGRKALALLPIILMDGTDPLIADQLEDSINNRLIMQTLVARSQGLKRQVILVTHNANIALLTKADRVIVLTDEGDRVHALHGTVVDEGARHVLDLLEGGSEPLRRRIRLYGDLLNESEPHERTRVDVKRDEPEEKKNKRR